MLIESLNIDNDLRYAEEIYYVPYHNKSRYEPIYVDDKYFYVMEYDNTITYYDKRAFRIIKNNPIPFSPFEIINRNIHNIRIALAEDDKSFLTLDGIVSKDDYQICYLENNLNLLNLITKRKSI